MKSIVIIAECLENRVRDVTFELISAALLLQQRNRGEITLVVPGCDPGPAAAWLARTTGMDVLALSVPELTAYNSDIYKTVLSQTLPDMAPSCVLVSHTSQGRDFAPGLALRLGYESISGINGIRDEGGTLLVSRPVLNGTRNSIIQPGAGPALMTIQPGAFGQTLTPPARPGNVSHRQISCPAGRIMNRGLRKTERENPALTKARVIVSAGRGIGGRENLEAITAFAEAFPSAAVGASRPLVDMGWIGYGHQVGITGAQVAPRLYIACGISGSSQHLAGMKDSEVVVSINTNPGAAINLHADICIQEDVVTFIRAFLDAG